MKKAELLELLKKYHVPKDEQTVTLSIDTLENALSEQPQIVLCKDCKQSGMDSTSYPQYWCSARSEYHDGEWFCADGERKEGR